MRLIGYQKFENRRGKYYRPIVQKKLYGTKQFLKSKRHRADEALTYGSQIVARYNRLFPGA